jgi:hypothetical protein
MGVKNRRDRILGTVSDLIADFLYYGRNEDGELPRGAIEEAIKSGEITVDEIVDTFRKELVQGMR